MRWSLKAVLISIFVASLLLASHGLVSQSTRALNSQPDPGIGEEAMLAMRGAGEGRLDGSTIGSLSGQVACPSCTGTGKVDCLVCNGTGRAGMCTWCGGTGVEKCLTCHGTGRCFACNATGKCQACESWYAVYDTPCPTCGGTGLCGVCDGSGSCYACGGKGGKPCWRCDGTGRAGKCQACGGTGLVECSTCAGTGLVEAEEEEDLGVLTHLEGDVKIIRNGEEVTDTGTPLVLRAKDEIRTGDDGEVEIGFPDGTQLRIAPNCRFAFGRLEQELIRGETFWGRIWALIRGKPWQIETSSAVTSVRGTEFELDVAGDGATRLTVLEGIVEFSDRPVTKSVVVAGYQTSVVAPGGTPSSPASIDPAQIDRWWDWEASDGEEPIAELPPGAAFGLPLALAWAIILVGARARGQAPGFTPGHTSATRESRTDQGQGSGAVS